MPRTGGGGPRALVPILALAALVPARPGVTAELWLGAASSLREPLTRIAGLFEAEHEGTSVRIAFGASSVLAMQARAGAPLDVLVSADERIAEALAREGLAAERRVVARNRLAVLVREGELGIRSPRDLAGADLRIAIPEHAVPVGRYARQWLARHGLAEEVAARALRTEHARATLAAVEHGHADAAVVYATDARLARSARVAFAIPESEQPHIAYVAIALVRARDPALARAFLEFLRGPDAADVLRTADFLVPHEDDAP